MTRDELNYLWISEMEITEEEKQLRAKIITEFENEIETVFKEQDKINNSKLSTAKKLLLLALLNTSYRTAYTNVVTKYFRDYVKILVPNVGDISDFSREWLTNRSQTYADEVVRTTLKYFKNGEFERASEESRRQTISRTEINAICECATLEGFIQEGYTRKRWETLLDGKERDTHRKANKQIRNITEPFDVGESQLLFPCDSSLGAAAKEVINCRCHMSPMK